MSDMAAANGAGARFPGETLAVNPAQVTNALLNATLRMAEKASSAQDTREAAEAAKAALALAQSIVVMDPNLTASGEPLQHALDVEALRGQTQVQLEQVRGENALKQARAAAAAPTPAKRVSIKRDQHGRATGYESEG